MTKTPQESLRFLNKEVEVISLIYKSTDYLRFIVDQWIDTCSEGLVTDDPYRWVDADSGWSASFRVVANDATDSVLDKLESIGVEHTVYNDAKPEDYYMNRVYRAWNFAGASSLAEHLCFVNSDMAFSPGWLKNLLKYHDGKLIPCSRLVESGKLKSGAHAISLDFGRRPGRFKRDAWAQYVESASTDRVFSGGLYMPCIFEKQKFVDSGGYPEGNIGGRSGDAQFFERLHDDYGMNHITVGDSLVYHIQEGEKDAF